MKPPMAEIYQDSVALLQVKDLSISFCQKGQTRPAIQNFSFDLHKGETLALVGESGSGKSVTALSILRLLPADTVNFPSGRVLFEGQDLLTLPETALRKLRGQRIGMVFQEPMTALNPLHKVEWQIAETLIRHQGLSRPAARIRVLELLTQVGIPEPEKRLDSYPHQLSGGQRQRVMIAMALANSPDILIADEPTTALDVTVQAQILTLLRGLQQHYHMALLFITHDLALVRHFAHRVCILQKGVCVEQGQVKTVFQNPSHPYTKMLLASVPRPALPLAEEKRPILLEVKQLRVWFPVRRGFFRRNVDPIKAVDGVDFTLRAGETLGIVGESGSGKTTLGRAVLRLIASTGQILYAGRDLQSLSWKEMRALRAEIQIVFQDPFGSLSPRLCIADIVAEGLRVHKKFSEQEIRAQVIRVLEEVGLDAGCLSRYPHEFSGGQRQRIAIARALILKPKFLILDEPTSALDRSVQLQVITLLQTLQRTYQLTYLFISHDLQMVRALATRIAVLHAGKIIEEGTTEALLKNPQTPLTRALLEATGALSL